MSLKYVQGNTLYLAGSGVVIGATSSALTSFADIYGNVLTMADFGALGYITFEPDTNNEEAATFTGVVANANGTYTLTGLKSALAKSPYTETSGLVRNHSGGTEVVITDNVAFWNTFGNKENDETLIGRWGTAVAPLAGNDLANKTYVDGVAIAGAPDSSTTVKGIGKTSVAPASPTNPIFVGDNDGRVPTQGENDALVGNNTDVAVGTGNKFVTQTGLQHNAEKYAADAEATDTYVITLSPAPTSYTNGMVVYFKANTANTGAATINVNSLGAKTIVKGVNTTLADNDIGAGMFCTLIYDGTNFVLQNPVSTFISQSFAGLFKNGTDSRAANAASGTQNIAHGLGVIPKKIKITTQITAGSGANVIHSQTIGVYDGTTTSMLWWEYNTTNATNQEDGGTDTTNIIYTQTNGDVKQVATVTFDATNIILAWTRTADAAGTIQIMWEAESA